MASLGMEGNISVLHVDDEPEFAELVATFLEDEDERFEVLAASSAAKGLDLLEKYRIDCVVSDYDMPQCDGLELLAVVREQHPGLPVILYTGKGSEEVASEAISAGVTDYLQKESGTTQYDVLANRIRNAVDQHRAHIKLTDREQRLNLFVEQAPLGVIRWDQEFQFARVNETAEGILGYEEDRLLGRSWELIVPNNETAEVAEVVSKLLDNEGGFRSVNENVREDDKRIVCEWHNRAVTDEHGEVIAVYSHLQDITERKERQRELKRHRAITRAASNTIVSIDEENTITSVNPAVAETFGYDPASIVGEQLTILMDDDLAQQHCRAFEQYLKTGKRTLDWNYFELDGQHKDGSTIPLSLSLGEITFDEERLFVGILRDISERKARENELTQINALQSTLLDALPQGVLAEDNSREVLASNQQLFELFNLPKTPEELIGADCEAMAEAISDMFAEPNRFVERVDTIVSNREPVNDESLHLTDGRTFKRSYRPLDLPDGEGHLWVYEDTTARTTYLKAVEELQCRTEELIAAADESGAASVAVSMADETLGFSLTGVHLVDDDRERLEPVAITDEVVEHLGEKPAYDRVNPSRPADLFNWQIFETGEPWYSLDIGNEVDISIDETPARSGIVFPLGDHGLFITSSPATNAFDEDDIHLVEILSTMLRAVLDRIHQEEQLEEHAQELQAKTRRLDEFTRVVSHDLRNPLTVAQGRLQVAMDECESTQLAHVQDALNRMEEMLTDLLALARGGNTVVEPTWVELKDIVEGCWNNVETREATISIDVDQRIRADEGQLKQLFENLFSNAVEHAGTDVTVTVRQLEHGFVIEDDGPGIPEQAREQIFEAGYSTSRDGTGFGLQIVEQIVDAHNWEITAAASPAGGARFEITHVEFDN